jgi:hypothetical protein
MMEIKSARDDQHTTSKSGGAPAEHDGRNVPAA